MTRKIVLDHDAVRAAWALGKSVKETQAILGVSYSVLAPVLNKLIPKEERDERRKRLIGAKAKGHKRRVGYKHSEAYKAKMRLRTGENNPNWKGRSAAKTNGNKRAVRAFSIENRSCGCGSPAQGRHHLDEDPHNNSEKNIGYMCRSCHAKEHGLGTQHGLNRKPTEG